MVIKRLFRILLICSCCLPALAQNLLGPTWKFKTGDNLEWAGTSFNDNDWAKIDPSVLWESQGYNGYDGYAWYRTVVVIPSDFKKQAEKTGGFKLNLSAIDDVDYTYWNGELIGKTGEVPPNFVGKYNEPRNYVIPANKILWDKPNTIAVRVFDGGGGGGIYGASPDLRVKDLSDFIELTTPFSSSDKIIKQAGDISVPLVIQNNLSTSVTAKITIAIVSDFGIKIGEQAQENVSIAKNGKTSLNFVFKNTSPGFYKAIINIESKEIHKKFVSPFGVAPERIVSPTDAQPDFQNYWDRAKKELAAVDPQYKITKVDSLSKGTKNIYVVEMRSLGNILVRGWYAVPKKPGKYPAILHVQGYSTFLKPDWMYPEDDMIAFGLNIRGHGFSKDNFNPWPTIPYILSGIEDKEVYVYRGAYMDCRRALDFIFSRPEVDTMKVTVEGGSQGGALSFATAALNPERIRLCVPHVPFLSDFRDYFVVANWPGNEFKKYIDEEHKTTWENAYNTLSYIDIKNLAPLIKCPVLMAVGLLDDVCPPHINFAAYNQLKSPKEYIVYPFSGHGPPNEYHTYKYVWIKKQLGMASK